jgi:DNA polymerase III subunit epsilon
MRQIVLDTETTGISIKNGNRMIEIGCVELVNRRLTGNHYHQYLQPDWEVEAGALKVHGISNEFLMDKPRFGEVVDEFLAYIDGAELIIHNAPFDVGFINHELALLKKGHEKIDQQCSIIDTLVMARDVYPGQKNNLDALCKRLSVNNTHRQLHGALLDSEILASVYLAMTGGQTSLAFEQASTSAEKTVEQNTVISTVIQSDLIVIRANEAELAEHEKYLDMLDKFSGQSVWRQ